MAKLDQHQFQMILDSYSVGKIVSILKLDDVLVNDGREISLSRCLVETHQGTYIIVFAPNDDLHSLWWKSSSSDFAATLSQALKLKNAKMLLTNQDGVTVHKFDLRISVFAL
ncbi:MAG: hypothetical protein KDD73_15445 [Anaerolineales bacterium]|nr:hypothetical protein [Anaerolineales bacterium]